jgi:hypothetical protein
MAKCLLTGFEDETTTEWLQREAKNLAMMLVKSNNGAGSSSEDRLAITDGNEPHGPDNPFLWTVVSRADFLKVKIPRDKESAAGRFVSETFRRSYGDRPSVVNKGKMPQQDAVGVARPTNMYTEEQCRRLVDGAIREFMQQNP